MTPCPGTREQPPHTGIPDAGTIAQYVLPHAVQSPLQRVLTSSRAELMPATFFSR